MPKISLEFDSSYESYFKLNEKGDYDVPQETLNRWTRAQKAWEKAQEEMNELRNIVQERQREQARVQQADRDRALEALVNEAFGS